MAAIETTGLTKHYGDVRAIQGLSFAVEEGEVFGFLGPNGAGKTTTIRTLMGFQSPTRGDATVLGRDVRHERELIDAKRRIGYLPADPAFDEESTGRRILDLHESIKGGERRADLLELFEPPIDRPVREYSSGNVQKLGLVQAFMHDPDLAILDEPTSGLDPLMQQRFNEFVRQEKEHGTTVFLSSHVLGEVRRICDRVGIIREGELVAVEAVEDLLHRSGKAVRIRTADALTAADLELDGVHDLSLRPVDGARDGETEAAFTYTGDFNSLVSFLATADVVELDVQEAPLEDVFMTFYGSDERPSPSPAETEVIDDA